ncbi:MAG: hypothetical protein ACJ740_12840 [Gaiellales bacterium]|nr:hypothetical protein [Gaiellales bacterium]
MSRVDHLTRGTVGTAPPPCVECMWWQTRPGGRPGSRERWTREAEDSFGPWGKLYAEDGRTIGQIQYGPSEVFPRALTLPAGPPSRDAVLITCAYLTDATSPWVLQSLFLAAIGESKDRGYPALEAFGYRYGPGSGFADRFLAHRTIFPVDFLRDFGFQPQRTAGRVELARLDLRGLVPVAETSLLERLKERLAPVPAPAVR